MNLTSKHAWHTLLLTIGTLLFVFLSACHLSQESQETEHIQHGEAVNSAQHQQGSFLVQRTEAEWKTLLPPKTFEIMRHEDTERAFSSPLHDKKEQGLYYCASCGQALFDSEHKYDSGTGWPSFYQPIAAERVGTREDHQLFAVRTEVHCSRCGGHLGHVFEDGPQPTGLRYCMNGAALSFRGRGVAAPPLLD